MKINKTMLVIYKALANLMASYHTKMIKCLQNSSLKQFFFAHSWIKLPFEKGVFCTFYEAKTIHLSPYSHPQNKRCNVSINS